MPMVSWKCPRCGRTASVLQGQEPMVCEECAAKPLDVRQLNTIKRLGKKTPSATEPTAVGCGLMACYLLMCIGVVSGLLAIVFPFLNRGQPIAFAVAISAGVSSLILIALGGVGISMIGRNKP